MSKSEYLQREEAAKKQLGAKGVKKRVKQLPQAARLSVKELTGVDISRKGVSVNAGDAALAAAGFIPFGKVFGTGARIAKAATRVSRAAKAANTARESMLAYEVAQRRGMQAFARKLAGFADDGWQLDQNSGFRNIERTIRRSDFDQAEHEIASRLSRLQRLQRSKRNR